MGRVIKVRDFSRTPGTRHTAEGLFSGEDFRNKVMNAAFKEALDKHVKLTIDLDNTIGYGTSWLEEVFGGLARSEGTQKVADTLVFISDEEPYLIDDIKSYIKDAEQQTH